MTHPYEDDVDTSVMRCRPLVEYDNVGDAHDVGVEHVEEGHLPRAFCMRCFTMERREYGDVEWLDVVEVDPADAPICELCGREIMWRNDGTATAP